MKNLPHSKALFNTRVNRRGLEDMIIELFNNVLVDSGSAPDGMRIEQFQITGLTRESASLEVTAQVDTTVKKWETETVIKGIVRATVESRFLVSSDFNITTESQVTELLWVEGPEISFSFIKISPTRLTNFISGFFKEKIADKLDNTLSNHPVPPEIVDHLSKELARPFSIGDIKGVGLEINLKSIMLNQLETAGKYVLANAGGELDIRLSDSKRKPVRSRPLFRYGEEEEKVSHLRVPVDISVKTLDRVLKQLLIGQAFGEDDKKIIVEDINTYIDPNKVDIKMQVSGSLDGEVSMNFDYVFIPSENELRFSEPEVKLADAGLLHKAIFFFIRSSLTERIASMSPLNLSSYIPLIQGEISSMIRERLKIKGLEVSVVIRDLALSEFTVRNSRIFLLFESEAILAFDLQKPLHVSRLLSAGDNRV